MSGFQDFKVYAAWLDSGMRTEIAKFKTTAIRKSCGKYKAAKAIELKPENRQRTFKDAGLDAAEQPRRQSFLSAKGDWLSGGPNPENPNP